MQLNLGLSSGRTSPESSATAPTDSDAFSAAWWARMPHSFLQGDGQVRVWLLDPDTSRLGAFSMLDTSEFRSEGVVSSSLRSVLETGSIPRKYYLSPLACRGILRRARKRGKPLPPSLQAALEQVARADGKESTTSTSPNEPMEMPEVAGTLASRTTGGSTLGLDFEVAGGLIPECSPTLVGGSDNLASHGKHNGSDRGVLIPEVANPVTARMGKGVNTTMDEGQTMVVERDVTAFDCKAGGRTGFSIDEKVGSLRGDGHGGGHAAVAFSCKDSGGDASSNDCSPTVRAMNEVDGNANAGGQLAVAIHENGKYELSRGKPGQGYPAIRAGYVVRRLTPRETERLQGMPDDHTLVPHRGKLAKDGPRYKAIGNSFAVPVVRWIGERIKETT